MKSILRLKVSLSSYTQKLTESVKQKKPWVSWQHQPLLMDTFSQ